MNSVRTLSGIQVVLGLISLLMASGCITVYHPMRGLQRPTLIDTEVTNFDQVRIKLHCVPGDHMLRRHARLLCRRLESLFLRQGALVDTVTNKSGSIAEEEEEARELERKQAAKRRGRGRRGNAGAEPAEEKPSKAGNSHDLIVRMESRLLDQTSHGLLGFFAVLTGTLSPTMDEYTFAQDITVHDGKGFLLVADTFQGRFIEYFGIGVWGVNKVLDMTVREEDEKVCGDAGKLRFSRQYYAQLSQVVFNANMRRQVLEASAPKEKVPAPTPTNRLNLPLPVLDEAAPQDTLKGETP